MILAENFKKMARKLKEKHKAELESLEKEVRVKLEQSPEKTTAKERNRMIAQELYEKMIETNMQIYGAYDDIKDFYSNSELKEELLVCFCDDLLTRISQDFMTVAHKYDKNSDYGRMIELFLDTVETLPEDENLYLWGIYSFLKGKKNKCLEFLAANLKKRLESEELKDIKFNEELLVDWFLLPYKDAFKGFWKYLAEQLQCYNCEKEVINFCYLLEDFYPASNEEKIDMLLDFISLNPNFHVSKEFLADTYYQNNQYKNARALYEMVGDNPYFFYMESIYFNLAWCYGKEKRYKEEELYYRKCLEYRPDRIYANNNLGYCLYRQKRYAEAEAIFKDLIEKEWDFPYPVNNLLRTLIAEGKNLEAKAFVKSGKYKISKEMLRRVSKLKDEDTYIEIEDLEDPSECEIDAEQKSADKKAPSDEEKKVQFSSEKILEDELTLRLEMGETVFGHKLRIYDHKGDYYGRQYPFPRGRLDLLCEDENDDLYIIELKKDSGYDDVYKQTAEYIDWFSKHKAKKGKKVYGIICLNNPTKSLIEKVHQDPKMQLFEYQISYREI